MKKILFTLALVMLAGCGGGGGGQSGGFQPVVPVPATMSANAPTTKAPEVPEKRQACHIVLYGDSIARGEPLIAKGPSRRIMELRPDWSVDLRAVAGESGADGAVRVLHDPREGFDVAVMEWGVNDILQKKDVGPMAPLIKQMQSEGLKVVVTGIAPYGSPLYSLYRDKVRNLAIDNGAAYASWEERMITTIDGIHPDQTSSDELVDDLINTLDKECP